MRRYRVGLPDDHFGVALGDQLQRSRTREPSGVTLAQGRVAEAHISASGEDMHVRRIGKRDRLAVAQPADPHDRALLVDADRTLVATAGRDRDQAAPGEAVVDVELLVAGLDA